MNNLNYPNISFTESTVGPTPTQRPWHDVVGVIGEFGRGPSIPVSINNRKDFQRFFGEDNTAGSLFVQQCMQQGHTNFVISRAVPAATPATGLLTFTSDNLNLSPQVGYNVNGTTFVPNTTAKTTGLSMEMSYIGSPLIKRSTFFPIESLESKVTNTSFDGRGRFVFHVVDFQEGRATQDLLSDPAYTIALTVNAAAAGEYQLATFSKSDPGASIILPSLKKGFALVESTQNLQDEPLVIVSDPFSLTSSTYGILLKGQFGFSNTATVSTALASPSTSVSVNNFKDTGVAVPSPDLPTLQKMNVVIHNVTYTQAAAPTGTTTLALTLSAPAPVLSVGDKVSFRPRIKLGSINLATNTFVVEGLLSTASLPVTSKITVGLDDTVYTLKQVTVGVNEVTVVTNEPLSSSFVKDGTSVLISPAAYSAVIPAQVCFAPRGHSVIGYRYESLDGQTLNAEGANSIYYSLEGTYNDGHRQYSIDSYFAVPEDGGGYFRPFSYQKAPSVGLTSAATLLTQPFGLSLRFGEQGIQKVALLEKGQFEVLFSRAVVSIGGKSGSAQEFSTGTPASEVITQLQRALYGDSTVMGMLATIKANLSIPPLSLDLTAAFGGSQSDRIFYKLSRDVTEYASTVDANATLSSTTVTLNSLPPIPAASVPLYSIKIGSDVYSVLSWNTSTKVVTLATGLLAPVSVGASVVIYSQLAARDILFNGQVSNYSTELKLEGGYDGSTYAQKTFYSLDGTPLVRVIALTPGSYGDRLTVSISPDSVDTDTATFRLDVEDRNTNVLSGPTTSESFLLSNINIDGQSGLYSATAGSTLIRAFFLPVAEPANDFATLDTALYRSQPLRLAPPLELYSPAFGSGSTALGSQGNFVMSGVPLQGGLNFNPPTLDRQQAKFNGYLSAVKNMADQDLALWSIAGISYGDVFFEPVFQEAINQTLNTRVEVGPRILVLEAPRNMPSRQASILSQKLNSDNIVLVRGHQVMQTTQNTTYPNIGCTGTYCGYNIIRPPHISPAAPYGGSLPVGVLGVDTESSPEYRDQMTLRRTEVLVYDSGLKTYKFLNGLTTSTDPTRKYLSTRRIMHQVIRDLYKYLRWVQSEPNNRGLQARVASACDAYLSQKLRDEWLLRVAPTICGPENNTNTDMITGRLNIRIRLTPVFPADFINVGIIRDLTEDFSLQSTPSTGN